MGNPVIDLENLRLELERAMSAASSVADLEIVKRDWLSKDGVLKRLFKDLRDLSPEDKPKTAAGLNQLRDILESFLREKAEQFAVAESEQAMQAEFLDLSLPASYSGYGSVHPVTKVERQIAQILRPFGFENVLGPEIETEYYCFDALNIPPHHPARDMQDTFYVDTGHVLRTHTTSVQARELQKGKIPVKVASFGRVYRNETEDASHQAMFHQFELV
ncbi:MAG: hypothetical protein KDD42_03655, partial [Bdellovibrionales bacterium]|nr:hypothetical protein [Bdellovibrionales bacterium]